MNDYEALIDELASEAAQFVRAHRQTPTATYRLQFRGDRFTFRDAAAVVPYLRDLGVSHIYCSPCLAACEGSAHGYDVVDHGTLDPQLGGEEGFRELVAALDAAGLRQIWDIVPNHMGIAGSNNGWWQNVLENGPGSPHAAFFDIDWQPAKHELHNKVLLPILGDQYGRVLEEGSLQLQFDAGAFWLRYYDLRLPIEPRSYETILSLRLDDFKRAQGEEAAGVQRLESIITACHHLPPYIRTEPALVEERQREKEMIKQRLAGLAEEEPAVGELIRETVGLLNGDRDDPESFNALDDLLNKQVYRLSHWKAAADEINYRRFFDINELAALCVEEPHVFDRTHEFTFERLVRGEVAGLRIDHVDGLFDPREYLCRLQRGYVARIGCALYRQWQERAESQIGGEAAHTERIPTAGSPFSTLDSRLSTLDPPLSTLAPPLSTLPEWETLEGAFLQRIAEAHLPELRRIAGWLGAPSNEGDLPTAEARPAAVDWPLYVVVEKILEQGEEVPAEWPVAGTTGYDFLNHTARLLVDPRGYRELEKSYYRFTQCRDTFAEIVYESKLLILRVAMASELQLLTARLNRLSEKHRRSRDFTFNNLRIALREILACFRVYRTYINGPAVGERDRHFVNEAVLHARRMNPAVDRGLFDFVRRVLLLESPPGLGERDELSRLVFVGRFQQASGPVMAKGVEDTAFYRFFPLSSLNEVGGMPAPEQFGAEEFHRENERRQQLRPASLTCTTTHDTKRTEDARARISVLSDTASASFGPLEWQRTVRRWARMNRRHVQTIDNDPAPSRNDEYLFYQSLIGIWPQHPPDDAQRAALCERLQQYMAKATHEAKQHTSWINPNDEYDSAVRQFVAAVLAEGPKNRFRSDFAEFHSQLADCGAYTALTQVFMKLASPGVPDIYQGQELWDYSLVDPDNRRPVDYELRKALLAEIRRRWEAGGEERESLVRELAAHPQDPRLKFFVTWQMLQFRRRHARLLRGGDYVPLEGAGPLADHVVAFAWRARKPPSAGEAARAVVVAPRLIAGLMTRIEPVDAGGPPLPFGRQVWGETSISLETSGLCAPGAAFNTEQSSVQQLFTGRIHPLGSRIELAEVLSEFPLALLVDRWS